MKQYTVQLLRRVQGIEPERLAQWASLGLLTLVAYSAAVTTWGLVTTLQGPAEGTPPPIVTPQAARPQPGTQPSLASLHLFGGGPVARGSALDAPETRLNLTLNGVIAADDRRIARAFIATMGGKEKSYSLDAQLPGGAVLKEIHADRVILSRDGQYETLRMPEKAPLIVLEDERVTDANKAGGGNQITSSVSRDEVLKYKEKLLTAPAELAGLVRQRPVRKDGKITGYRVFAGSDRELFDRVGLKPGDIITGVNGLPLSDPASAMALYGQLSTMAELNVQLERQGQTMSLQLPWN